MYGSSLIIFFWLRSHSDASYTYLVFIGIPTQGKIGQNFGHWAGIMDMESYTKMLQPGNFVEIF